MKTADEDNFSLDQAFAILTREYVTFFFNIHYFDFFFIKEERNQKREKLKEKERKRNWKRKIKMK